MISRDNDIANELREILPDAQWITPHVAQSEVPGGYFEQLPEEILQKVHIADVQDELETLSPLLAGMSKSLPLSVPQDYFRQFPQKVLEVIHTDEKIEEVEEELAQLSPLLASLPRTMPLSVPAGYFDQLDTTIMANVGRMSTAAVTPVVRRMNTRPYRVWVAAASLIALVSVSTLLFTHEKRHKSNGVENALANISDQEIMEYLQAHTDAFDKEELTNYTPLIEETNAIQAVEELPAEAIEHYLDNIGLLNESLTDN